MVVGHARNVVLVLIRWLVEKEERTTSLGQIRHFLCLEIFGIGSYVPHSDLAVSMRSEEGVTY